MNIIKALGVVGLGLAIVGCGCGVQNRPANSGPSKGTLDLEKLTPDQQIEKIKNDKSIPDQYKQTYINSVRAKAGASH